MSDERYGLICLTCNEAQHPDGPLIIGAGGELPWPEATMAVAGLRQDDPLEDVQGWTLDFIETHVGHLLSLVPEARVREVWEDARARETQTPDERLAELRSAMKEPRKEPQVLWQTDDPTRPAWLLISADLMREAFRPDQDIYRIPVTRIDVFEERSVTLIQGAVRDKHGVLTLVNNAANRDGVGGLLAPVKLVPDEPTPCEDCRNGHCDAGYWKRLGRPGTCPDYKAKATGLEALKAAGEAMKCDKPE